MFSRLAGKSMVLGITGGIAAYKAAELCRLLVKAGVRVRVVMTAAATQFIAPLTLQTLSGAPVGLELLDADAEARISHIRLGDEADAIVIAPASADSIARFAAGMANDLLTAVVLASQVPVLLAPAMNVNMWQNPITQQNLGRLLGTGRFRTVGPDSGELACGWVGAGRLIEPPEIVEACERMLTPQDLVGRRIVVTAGPTLEPVDDVRSLANRSSGKMGFAVAVGAARRGAEVTLIAGPVALSTPTGGGIRRVDVETAEEMRAALADAVPEADAVVMAAAVSDFRPATRARGKLSRRAKPEATPGSIPLVANADLLAELGRNRRGGRPLLVGFAAEVGMTPESLVLRAREKLVEKGCDLVVANDVGASGIGFGSDDNAVTLVFPSGVTEAVARAPKLEIANVVLDRVVARLPRAVGSVPLPRRRVPGVRPAAARRATAVGPTGSRGRRG